jgi:hypothetical protein
MCLVLNNLHWLYRKNCLNTFFTVIQLSERVILLNSVHCLKRCCKMRIARQPCNKTLKTDSRSLFYPYSSFANTFYSLVLIPIHIVV